MRTSEQAAAIARLEQDVSELRADRDAWRAQALDLTAALAKPASPVDEVEKPGPRTAGKGSPDSAAGSGDAFKREAGDVLYGMPAIAAAFGWRTRQAEHLKDAHGLPTFKVGKTVCARRLDVLAWINAHGDAALSASQGRN